MRVRASKTSGATVEQFVSLFSGASLAMTAVFARCSTSVRVESSTVTDTRKHGVRHIHTVTKYYTPWCYSRRALLSIACVLPTAPQARVRKSQTLLRSTGTI